MHRFLAVMAAVATAVAIVGCIETKQDYTLNPDGSGKVAFDLAMEDMPFNLPVEGEKPSPDLQARQFTRQVLDGSKGVDAWADVSYERTPDSRTRFRGTAYFKSFKDLKFQSAQFSGITFEKDDKGGMVLLLEEKDKAKAAPAAPPAISPEELANRVKAEREKFQQMRVMMDAVISKVKMDLSFRLPGMLAEVSNLQKEPSGAVRFVMEGARMLKAMDDLMADDAYVREVVLAGQGAAAGPKMDDRVKEKLFGSSAPIRARVTGDLKPLFAYDAEVTAAKANYPKMIERLGLDKIPAPPPIPLVPPGVTGPGEPPTGRKTK